jgi:hypothetical protein
MLKLALASAVAAGVLGFAAGWRVHGWRDASAALSQAKAVIRGVEHASSVSQRAALRDQATQDQIRTVTKTLIEKVPIYVTRQTDALYSLPAGFVRLHDAAARGGDLPSAPQGPGQSDDTPSGVALSTAAATIVANYGGCRADQQRLADLQRWLKDQGLAP